MSRGSRVGVALPGCRPTTGIAATAGGISRRLRAFDDASSPRVDMMRSGLGVRSSTGQARPFAGTDEKRENDYPMAYERLPDDVITRLAPYVDKRRRFQPA